MTRREGPMRRSRWAPVAAWALAWICLFALDPYLDLANKALILVLTAAVAAIWSGPWISLLASAAAVLAFNFSFVPPRGVFTVDLHQHALLLVAMLTVSWIVALLVTRLRWHAAQAGAHSLRSDQLRRLGDALRAEEDPALQAAALQDVLSGIAGSPTTLWLAGASHDAAGGEAPVMVGPATADEAAGLRLCLQEGRAMGPGTGRHEEQPAWYLPLRGRQGPHGAALVRDTADAAAQAGLLAHAQALCDQLGSALERAAALRAASAASEQAQSHALRNTLLTAISHDHRTPLATILGAASALHDQGERLSTAQIHRLAATIVDEAAQLSRLTDNTLQLARLGAAGLALRRDWESVEEMVGTVLRRVRQRDPSQRVKARVEPGLPLLRCDAVLIVQLLDNLVDNALKHGGAGAPVEVLARRRDGQVVIAVRDRGQGVPPALRERIFDTFQRGDPIVPPDDVDHLPRRGAGIGVALCRAIAQVHGGELRLRPRAHGGASFELTLPVDVMPDELVRGDTGGPVP
jgi:two-component system sensor histidine kinase KdpD